jgi:hypothetical protein
MIGNLHGRSATHPPHDSDVVFGSMTSALRPMPSSISAAPIATCTTLLVATIVMARPLRLTSATPDDRKH